MGSLIDLTGKKFGRLTVIKRSYPNTKWGLLRWLCKCECGAEKITDGGSLRNGHARSCGCLRKEITGGNNRLNPGLANMRSLMRIYKMIAKKREYTFELTEEQFAEITKKDCFYCGAKPRNVFKNKGCIGIYIYNGLDRVDNKKGYTIDNVVPCCKKCNQAKNDSTLQEFQDWAKKLYNKMFGEKK